MDRQLKLNLIKDINDIESVSVDEFWNYGERELAMHKIHAYPAKFPAFITTKAVHFLLFTPQKKFQKLWQKSILAIPAVNGIMQLSC